MYNQTTQLDPPVEDLFRLLENCTLLFCSDLAVLIFPKLLLIFKDLIESQHRVLGNLTIDNQLFYPFPLYCFTLIKNRWFVLKSNVWRAMIL